MRQPWWSAAGLAALVALAGCASPIVEEDLGAEIRRYYAAHATEEDGACPDPQIASIMAPKPLPSEVVPSTLTVAYSYFDPSVEEAPDWSHVLVAERACTGFGEREFTLLRRKSGTAVVDMSGERRKAK